VALTTVIINHSQQSLPFMRRTQVLRTFCTKPEQRTWRLRLRHSSTWKWSSCATNMLHCHFTCPIFKLCSWSCPSFSAVNCHFFPPGRTLPSQPQTITMLWQVPDYTAWRHRTNHSTSNPTTIIKYIRIQMQTTPVQGGKKTDFWEFL